MTEKPYIETKRIVIDRKYNPKYGDDKICKCGHLYYRHFDSYEDNYPCGCKYCNCYDFELKLNVINYIVSLQGFNDRKKIECETIQQVWDAIGERDFGGLYQVESPTGKDINEFIPF